MRCGDGGEDLLDRRGSGPAVGEAGHVGGEDLRRRREGGRYAFGQAPSEEAFQARGIGSAGFWGDSGAQELPYSLLLNITNESTREHLLVFFLVS